MAFVINATWVTTREHQDTVRAALVDLAVRSSAEPGNRAYIPYESPDDAATFGIFEVYDDEDAFQAHLDSDHFRRLALERAIPLLIQRDRRAYRTVEAAPQ